MFAKSSVCTHYTLKMFFSKWYLYFYLLRSRAPQVLLVFPHLPPFVCPNPDLVLPVMKTSPPGDADADHISFNCTNDCPTGVSDYQRGGGSLGQSPQQSRSEGWRLTAHISAPSNLPPLIRDFSEMGPSHYSIHSFIRPSSALEGWGCSLHGPGPPSSSASVLWPAGTHVWKSIRTDEREKLEG